MIHDLTKQHHYDIRKNEENIQRLCDEIVRIERMFEVLWEEMRRRGSDLHIKPQEHPLLCSRCNNLSNRYHITSHEGGYYRETICVDCFIKDGEE